MLSVWHKFAQLHEQEALLLQRECMTCMSVEILQLRNIPFETDCNRQMTLKVIAIAVLERLYNTLY